jgi:hypothetical protein
MACFFSKNVLGSLRRITVLQNNISYSYRIYQSMLRYKEKLNVWFISVLRSWSRSRNAMQLRLRRLRPW